ncbi:MAG: hypothetical protein LBQ69_06555 [Treponema sp.]|jgi:hypothetical protein|nr:hypothetical protein [Treponema sp.]
MSKEQWGKRKEERTIKNEQCKDKKLSRILHCSLLIVHCSLFIAYSYDKKANQNSNSINDILPSTCILWQF